MIRQRLEVSFASAGQTIVNAAAAIDRFPVGFEGTIHFQAPQQWINESFAGLEYLSGPQRNRLHNLVTVHFTVREQLQYEQLRYSGKAADIRSHCAPVPSKLYTSITEVLEGRFVSRRYFFRAAGGTDHLRC